MKSGGQRLYDHLRARFDGVRSRLWLPRDRVRANLLKVRVLSAAAARGSRR